MSASILEHFAPVPDFRIERNKVYPLPEIPLLVVSGGAHRRRRLGGD